MSTEGEVSGCVIEGDVCDDFGVRIGAFGEREVLRGVRSVIGSNRFLGVRNRYLGSLIYSRYRRGHYKPVTVLPELRVDHRRSSERASR